MELKSSQEQINKISAKLYVKVYFVSKCTIGQLHMFSTLCRPQQQDTYSQSANDNKMILKHL